VKQHHKHILFFGYTPQTYSKQQRKKGKGRKQYTNIIYPVQSKNDLLGGEINSLIHYAKCDVKRLQEIGPGSSTAA